MRPAARVASRDGWRTASEAAAALIALAPLPLDPKRVAEVGAYDAAREARDTHPLIREAVTFRRALAIEAAGGTHGHGHHLDPRLGSAIVNVAVKALRAHNAAHLDTPAPF